MSNERTRKLSELFRCLQFCFNVDDFDTTHDSPLSQQEFFIKAMASSPRTSGAETDSNSESTKWLSHVLQRTWPAASAYAPRLFKEFIEPALLAQMPSFLPKVHFSRVILGTKAPRMESIHILPDRPERSDMVALEAEFIYDGDMDIELTLGSGPSVIKFGMMNTTIRGQLEILVGPMIPRLPFIAACQVGFINAPEIDYKLTGLATIADSELFRTTFRKTTQKIFNDLFTLPSRVFVPIDTHADFLKSVRTSTPFLDA